MLKKILLNIKKFINFINKDYNNRIIFLRNVMIFLSIFALFGLIYRSFFVKKNNYKNIQLNSVYDRNNNLMAYNVIKYQININPKKVNNITDLYYQFSHLKFNKEDFIKNINENEVFVFMKDLELADIEGVKHQSISILKFIKRKYPLNKNFSTIGVCDLNKGIIKGIETLAIKDNVFLTIDIRIQNILANILERAYIEYQPQMCFGIVINLNGEVLAVHETNCTDTENITDFFNNVFYGLFEYGSTCKIFTVFAGFYYDDFNIKTIFDTEEGKTIFNRVIFDYEAIPRFSDLFTIISKSSNRGTTAASRKIGRKLVDFYKIIKLNEPVDIGFTKTIKPRFFKDYKNDEILGMGFGYNFMTNAFNILRAFLIIFTKGKIINPTLLKNDIRNRIIGNVEMNKEKYDDIISIMKFTATRHPKLEELGCASKSGTVDRIINGHYDSHRVNSYFICAVPGLSGKYEYIMLLAMIDPADYKKAGINLRNMAAKIAEQIFNL